MDAKSDRMAWILGAGTSGAAAARLLAARGAAVLVSSHQLSELEHICTSVCIIENGVIISRRALGGDAGAERMPMFTVVTDDFRRALDILSVLVKSGLCASRSEARRAVEQGGVSADGVKISDIKFSFSADALRNGVLVKRGKKNFKKVVIK